MRRPWVTRHRWTGASAHARFRAAAFLFDPAAIVARRFRRRPHDARGAGAGENDMIMIAGNLAGSLQSGAGQQDTGQGRIAVSVYQALSQGHVRITSRAPDVDPGVEERMLSDERDLVRMRDGIRRLRDICRHPAVTAVAERAEYGLTGIDMTEVLEDAALDDWLFGECSDAQHASGTCRMGTPDDPRSVVDPACRVIGCSGLRVIDASVMPEVVRANTHLTTVAVAERMADLLRGRIDAPN
jgi:5-(hydroxymethyl)furfural/furfural oxidase